MSILGQFQFRRDTAANWTSEDPILLAGEMGLETDTGKFKIGDGSTEWTGLAYSSGPAGATGATGAAGPNEVNTTTDTAIAGLLKGAAGKVAQAVAGTDYLESIPAPTTTTLGGVKRNTGTSGQFVTGIDTDGSLLRDTPAGSGTVTSVAVSGSDGIEVDSGSPITSSGTIALGVNASTLKTHIALDNVENTAISTFAGSANITTIGTISTGTVPVANVSGLGTAATTDSSAYAPALGVDDNYVTDAEKIVIGNTSGTNTGDNAVNSLYSGLVSNATHTGDVTGATALTIANGAVTEAKCNSSINASLDLADSSIQPGNAALTDERVPTAAGLTSKFGTNKATIADGDKIALLDSAATDAPKHSLFSLVKSTLKTYFDTLYAAALGVDDNYVTDAEKTVIGNTSGTNTGDQDLSGYVLTTAIDTLAELNAVITDATLIDTNDARLSDARTPAAHSHEGTAILSTGEVGGTKFLREDGDGTSSWQPIAGGGDALVGNPLSQFAATTSSQLAGVISDETGSGSLVFATSPTLVTPALGTPSSGTLTNCTGLPEAGLVDDAVTLAKMASGTAGNLITYDASGNPAAVATGTAGQVLTSGGAGVAPTFQAAGGGDYIGALQSDIAELAFDVAILQNVGVYEMANGVAITYDDSTGIDAGSSSNYTVDASAEKVINQTVSENVYTGSVINFAWNDYCWVQNVSASQLAADGAHVRLLMIASTSTTTTFDDVFVSRVAASGDAYDSHSDLTRVTFGGANGVTIPANGSTWSDWIPYSLDSSQDLLVCINIGNTSAGYYDGATGFTNYYKISSNDAGTENRSGFLTTATRRTGFTQIDVTSAPLSLSLVSTSYAAPVVPTEVAFTLRFVEPDSDVTLNTDLIVEISRDGGTTWSAMTLTELRTAGTTVVASGTVDVSAQPSGSSLKTRITTPGGTPKAVEIVAHTLQLH